MPGLENTDQDARRPIATGLTICVPAGHNPAYHPWHKRTGGSKGMHPVTEELCNKARALGLDSLTEGHLAQFYEDATGWTKRHPPELSD